MFSAAALWSMKRYQVPVLTVIFNNKSYEEVRWQIMGRGGESAKANRDYIGYLGDPEVDFTKLASAYNIDGAVVRQCSEQLAARRDLSEGSCDRSASTAA